MEGCQRVRPKWRADRRQLYRPLLAGTVGSVIITIGSSQSSSPFAEHSNGAWFFRLSLARATSADNQRLIGVLLVYAGIVLLLGSWYALARSCSDAGPEDRPQLHDLVMTLAAWSAPLLFAAPLFSRDVYSYAAQGAMLADGISPYRYGAAALQGGGFLSHVDPIWRHAIAPYGPGWERLVEGFVVVTGHRLLGTLVLLRATSLVSLAILAWGIPRLAKATGHSSVQAFIWAVLNPLILLTLLGGAHNDGLMLALVVVGLVAAQRGHPFLGTMACALGAEVKAPALLAVVFIGWWSTEGRRPSQRAIRTAGYLAVAAVVLVVLSLACRLGWGWVHAALTPGKVVSWLDPATAVALALSHLTQAAGLGAHRAPWIAVARVCGLVAAGAIAIRMLARSNRRSGLAALGVSFLGLALLGPVVWPWYETWGIVVMSTAADNFGRWKRAFVIGLSGLGCFADFPSATVLVGGSPALVGAGWTAFVLGAASYFCFGVGRLVPASRDRLLLRIEDP